MRYLPLFLLTLSGCVGGPNAEPAAQQALRLARGLGGAAVNVYLVPKLRADFPQIMAVLDSDANGQLAPEEMENLLHLSDADAATLLLLVMDAMVQQARR
jgi:hypothetical protein